MSKKQFEDKISAALGRRVTAKNVLEGGHSGKPVREVLEIQIGSLHFRVMDGEIVARRSGSKNWIVGMAA